MTSTREMNKRIAKNTAMLYVRLLVTMVVALYTSRVILGALGVEDFGIYNAVGGFVAMFTVISGSLSAAIARFITFELGRGDTGRLARVFSAAVAVQLAIAAAVVLLGETAGLWFLHTKMSIPPGRLDAAGWVLQFSLLAFVVNLLSVPYNACIVAHERMSAFAWIGMAEAGAKLAVAYLVGHSPADRLATYAALLAAVALAVCTAYATYCGRHFAECRFRPAWDGALLREMAGFAGWNFIGSSSGVLRDQGVNVLLNVFCGPAVNAARGIAVQVSTAVNSFTSNFMTALNPQITKSYARGDRDYLMTLVCQGSRLSFYLLLFLSLPLLVEMPAVLRLWLGIVPDHAVAFARWALVYVMSESISYPLVTLMLATGRIRNYQLLVGGCQMLNFPVAYALLKAGCAPEATMALAVAVAWACLALRLVMLRRMVGLPVRRFLRGTVLNVLAVGLVAAAVPLLVASRMDGGWPRLLAVAGCSVASVAAAVYFVGCTARERRIVREKAAAVPEKIKQRIWKRSG